MRFRESFRRFGKNQSGAIGAEFAIVGTLFCVVILVMIQMGVMFYSYNVMQNAARDGVRRLAVDNDMYISVPYDGVDCSSDPATTTVDGYLSVEAYTCGVLQLFADAKVRACLTDSSGGGPPNSRHDAEVVVTADMAEVGILDLFGVASGFTMTAIAVMRMEDGKIYNPLDSADEPIPLYVCAASVPPITT